MSKENHGNHHGHHDHSHPQHKSGGGLHKDWRAWTVVLIMIAAMAVYILSFDESEVPGEPEQQEVPAAAE